MTLGDVSWCGDGDGGRTKGEAESVVGVGCPVRHYVDALFGPPASRSYM